MTNRDPQAPLLQLDGERGFVFCDLAEKRNQEITSELNINQESQ
jgi:hypothetical protein